MRSSSPSSFKIGFIPRPRYICKRRLVTKMRQIRWLRVQTRPPHGRRTHAVPSSSCSAAGSLSSSWRSSSLSRVSSACLLATALSASFNPLARDNRAPSRWLRFSAWRSAEGTLGGRVEDVRAASRTCARAGMP